MCDRLVSFCALRLAGLCSTEGCDADRATPAHVRDLVSATAPLARCAERSTGTAAAADGARGIRAVLG